MCCIQHPRYSTILFRFLNLYVTENNTKLEVQEIIKS